MFEVTCVLGNRIKLANDRYIHIILKHPELEGMEDEIKNTLIQADFIQRSVYDSQIFLYYKEFGKDQYFVVVVKVLNKRGFIITSYIADVIKKSEVIWKK
ncbi:MAG: hypothetical protein HY831_00540 [Candidatus Aenigmarchaeota archaeon]|nr:hypothetical protein [Candidatus Aenigmarchaeota archaeon]